MNRRDRRRLGKGAAAAGTGGTKAPRGTVSDFLLGLGGVKPVAPAAVPMAAAEASPLQRTLADARSKEKLAADIEAQQKIADLSGDPGAILKLARLQLLLDRRDAALVSYRRLLERRPDDPEARHMVGILSGATPEKVDPAYVARLFDAFADTFDDKLTNWLDYQAPQHVAAMAKGMLGEGRIAARAVDLGCGTGLLGPLVKAFVATLDGVDLSPRMLEKARARQIYDNLHEADAVAFLARHPAAYDVALAADVLNYIGALDDLFRAARSALLPGGLLVATVEKADGFGFVGTKSGRYAHGEPYVRAMAAEAGLAVRGMETVELRKESNRPVLGLCMALQA